MTPLLDALGRAHVPYPGEPRIVSLVPSLTELVCDLGLGDSLAGRTGFCVHPREILRRVPKVGGTKDVRLDLLRRIAPTHVIADIDENRRAAVEEIMEFVPNVIVVHPRRLEDNLALYSLIGGVFRRDAEAAELSARFAAARTELLEVTHAMPRENVLYPIWRDPWMTVGRDTYIAAMLAAAGWDTQPENAPGRFPTFSWDAPWMAQVQCVLLPSEPYAFTNRESAEISGLCGRPVLRIDGEMVSWYGSRAVAGMRYLADLRQAYRGVSRSGG